MSHGSKILIFCLILILAWSLFVRFRFAPAPPPHLGDNDSLELPEFRKLSPYPEISELPSPIPAPTVNQTLVCPDDMVKVDNFCMDKYEYPNKLGALPKTEIDWYKAKELCESLGKRLCGEDEWIRACHTSETPGKYYRYSYGDSFIMENCNIQNTKAVRSGSFKKCKSYYGAFDMVGNVYEWVNPRAGKKPTYALGGSWGEGAGATCYKAGAGYQPLYYQVHIGFRCCK